MNDFENEGEKSPGKYDTENAFIAVNVMTIADMKMLHILQTFEKSRSRIR